MFVEETTALYTPESRPSKSIAYLFLPMELDVIESVILILSLESKIEIDNLDDAGLTMLKIALELSSKFVFSINVTITDTGYWPIPNKAASDPFSCFIITV